MRHAVACLLLAGVVVPAAAGDETLALLRIGGSFSDGFVAGVAGEWLCVVEGKPARLVPCRVYSPPLDPSADTSDEWPDHVLRVREDVEPLFLVRGLTGPPVPRDVPTYAAGERPLVLGAVPTGDPGGGEIRVTQEGEHEVRIALRSGGREQQLVRIPNLDINGYTALHWAGDLDGDGKLDLLLDVTYHQAFSDLRLYLSSRAAAGELVGEAAVFYKAHC